MKKKFIFLLIAPLFLLAQTKKNGTIYNEHPTLELVKEFDEAFVAGNLEKLKSLVTDDFKFYNGLSTNFVSQQGSKLDALLGNSKYWSEKLDDFKIESRGGGSYPDALEFKGGQLWVYTYDVLSGYDKENGFKIMTPYDRSILFNKEGDKIHRIIESFNTEHLSKYNSSFLTTKNGTIYKDHPFIGVVRRMMSNFERGNLENAYADFLPNARMFDSNMPFGESLSVEEHKKGNEELFKNFEILSVNEWGYPDLLEYNGDGYSLISWWVVILKNKKTNKETKVQLHNQLTLNNEGKILRSVDYYNGAALNP
ncbi:MAG: hypothetical protein VW262_04665 [Flavobacteriaceae bacterium]